MSVMISKERSDVCELTAVAIKATYETWNVDGVERCIYALNNLKSLSLSVKDIFACSESVHKLEPLRSHRNPNIRKEAQALFHSWMKTIYTQGRDNSFKDALMKAPLKLKKHVLTRSSELKKKEVRRSMDREVTAFSVLKNKEDESDKHPLTWGMKGKRTWARKKQFQREDAEQNLEAAEVKKIIKLSELNKKEDQRSLAREPEMIKEEPRNDFLALRQKEDHKYETCDDKYFKKESETGLKPLNMKRVRVALEDCSNKMPREDVPYVLSSGPLTKKTKTEKELRNKKVDKMVELFEAGKKAADLANVKGVLRGKPEVSRCVDALSLLMKIDIAPKPKEPKRIMERLEGLTKHKDRKIVHAASALLHLWRQRNREDELEESVTKCPNNSHIAH